MHKYINNYISFVSRYLLWYFNVIVKIIYLKNGYFVISILNIFSSNSFLLLKNKTNYNLSIIVVTDFFIVYLSSLITS